RLVARLRRFFVSQQVGIVHPVSSTAEFFAGLAARCGGIPLVASLRGAHAARAPARRGGKRLGCVLPPAAPAHTTPGGARVAVAAGLVDADKVHVIPNGLALRPPSTAREEMRRRLGIPAGATAALSVGRLVREKGYELTLAIARHTGAWQPAPRFLIAGD